MFALLLVSTLKVSVATGIFGVVAGLILGTLYGVQVERKAVNEVIKFHETVQTDSKKVLDAVKGYLNRVL